MITQNFNTGRLVTTKKHPALATAVEKYIGPRTVPIVQKKSENCDKFGHKCRNRKIKTESDIQKARISQTKSFVNT